MASIFVNAFAGEIKSGGRFKAAEDATDDRNVDSVVDSPRQFIFYTKIWTSCNPRC